MVWYCDTCLCAVVEAGVGRIEWISLYGCEPGGRDLRLVHDLARVSGQTDSGQADSCQFDARREYERDKGKVNGAPLADFLGPDGLMRLLGLMAVDRLPAPEVMEMIKRLHVPGYEEARTLLRDCVNSRGLKVVSRAYYPSQSEISSTLRAARARPQASEGAPS